ncbi:MAG: phosphoenolpyruvate--protein phosphotransferase [Chromatiaceae bacterium]|nr:phosphoenolpyruvate--protein phosphotransferase [Gammaproteobacteria bacterium]MCP5422932.1 phosphoenolpyruvate--protein phosphotransferase [Chromatiaceae bacterium]
MSVACIGTGIGGASAIATGEAYLVCRGPVCVTPSWIDTHEIEAEVERFEGALRTAAEQLRSVRQQIPDDTPSDIAEFIDTHLLMIEDKAISSQPIHLIRNEGLSAEWALQQHRDSLMRVFEQMDDPYLRTRCDDLDHVVNRVVNILLEQHEPQFGSLEGHIVLAEDLTPADVILMKNQGVAGFVTDYGGPMSHTSILARSLGLPAVVGARGATSCLQHGEPLILDAEFGIVLADCDDEMLAQFEALRDAAISRTVELRRRRAEPAATHDGQRVTIRANIELAEDVAKARANGADGIGLYRTEFLYMNRPQPPTEDEHFAAYLAVVEGMQGQPVTIRTLDLGADKRPGAGLHSAASANPALGLRAIRLCLKEPELFYPQVRAILRASAFGPVRLMLPMLTNVWEVDQARRIIELVMQQLDAEGVAFDRGLPIGGMIEVPAAALAARAFATRLDFLSIGTNDLIQYTLAIDRVDDELTYLYDPAHPAVLRLIHEVLQASTATGTAVGMCGEMAGDVRFLPLLVGMGLRDFSMQPDAILDIREQLRSLDARELVRRVDQAFAAAQAEDTDVLLAQLIEPR